MMLDGEFWELPAWVPNTDENEYGFLPTPLASDGDGGGICRTKNGREYNLRDWWAMSEIAAAEPDPALGIRLANKKEIADVVPETQELLSALPGLEYMRIAKVGYYSTGKKGRKFDKAPKDVRFFRFAAGYGCVSIKQDAGK